MLEQAHIFSSRGKKLVAIEHIPTENLSQAQSNKPSDKGLIIVVGGPQTRVGSHRLFVDLARALAKQGIHVYRFDYTGAGDSEGEIATFTDIQADIAAAIANFQQLQPQITQLSLWGLCDAASAILLYLSQYSQENAMIDRLVLVNPWVRQVHTQAQAYLKSYYLKRIISQDFWKKLLTGKVKARAGLRDVQGFHQQSKQLLDKRSFVEQMRQGLSNFQGKSAIILSGNDLTADEFTLLVESCADWQALLTDTKITTETIKFANHTFSAVDSQHALFEKTLTALLSN
jgi:exosortase A-associated hydrolase 1